MKNCKRVTQIVSDGQERPLKASEALYLRSHLFFCPGCRAFQDNAKTISRMMKSLAKTDD